MTPATPPPSRDRLPVGDDDLHALVDGQLAPDRRAAVLAHLADRPEVARRVADWSAQREALRARLVADDEPGPLPPGLAATMRRVARAEGSQRTTTAPPTRWSPFARAAVVVAAVAVGAWAGAAWERRDPSGGTAPRDAVVSTAPAFVGEARAAHAVYTPERRHPVEVTAADEQHLVQWLSRRLGTPLRLPDLQPDGWRLLGGRLLPAADGPRAQFMYEDAAARRLTLYVTVFEPGDRVPDAAFRSTRDGDVASFYWIEDRLGYALSASVPDAELQQLARSVHRQLRP